MSLAVVPFGESQAPYFAGTPGSYLTIDVDPRYSQSYANALTVAAWICPLALDNARTEGKVDQFVHLVEKAVGPSTDLEWVQRLHNQTNPKRHSRLSFYTFTWVLPSARATARTWNKAFPPMTRLRSSWANGCSSSGKRSPGFPRPTRPRLHPMEQAVKAVHVRADTYVAFNVHAQDGSGPLTVGGTQKQGYKWVISHLAIWNRQLSAY